MFDLYERRARGDLLYGGGKLESSRTFADPLLASYYTLGGGVDAPNDRSEVGLLQRLQSSRGLHEAPIALTIAGGLPRLSSFAPRRLTRSFADSKIRRVPRGACAG